MCHLKIPIVISIDIFINIYIYVVISCDIQMNNIRFHHDPALALRANNSTLPLRLLIPSS